MPTTSPLPRVAAHGLPAAFLLALMLLGSAAVMTSETLWTDSLGTESVIAVQTH